MDPNATLEMIADALETMRVAREMGDRAEMRASYADACDAARYLIGWLRKDGFEPDWSKHEQAANWFTGRTGYIPRDAR
jgi:hypothetical protein